MPAVVLVALSFEKIELNGTSSRSALRSYTTHSEKAGSRNPHFGLHSKLFSTSSSAIPPPLLFLPFVRRLLLPAASHVDADS